MEEKGDTPTIQQNGGKRERVGRKGMATGMWSSSEESEKNSTSLEKLREKSSILFVWTAASLCLFCLLDVGILFACLFVFFLLLCVA
jgi:hypothetical protein